MNFQVHQQYFGRQLKLEIDNSIKQQESMLILFEKKDKGTIQINLSTNDKKRFE